jgi:hypothetical protein
MTQDDDVDAVNALIATTREIQDASDALGALLLAGAPAELVAQARQATADKLANHNLVLERVQHIADRWVSQPKGDRDGR